jgi:DNA-binding NarL/FixJ family response regulator
MASARRKLLCIEDDRDSAAVIATELVKRGFAVTVAHGGEHGLLAILKSTPDLVLCQIDMASMTGFEVLQRLSTIAPPLGRIPFLFLVGPDKSEPGIRTRLARTVEYVSKPIDFHQLTSIINARLTSADRAELNHREILALTWVARGATSTDIARRLKLSKRTVDFHVTNARIKLHARTRTEAVIKAATSGLIKP